MKRDRHKKPREPLDPEALERLALRYVGRYATSRAKLASYLTRKIAERGWSEAAPPPVTGLVERFAGAGYVDDAAFASARAASLQRRGYGERRIGQALRVAGIADADAAEAQEQASAAGWAAALRFAERKGIGPYAANAPDRSARERAFAAMLRAGHRIDHVRRVLNSRPGEIPEQDNL